MDFYRGYISCNGKAATMPFQKAKDSDLLTLEEARRYPSYAGVLANDAVLIDVDNAEQAEILLRIVKSKELKCRVLKTTKGAHFLFKTNHPMTNRTAARSAIGLSIDIKGAGRASYEVIRLEGQDREVLYDTDEYQFLPKWLTPVKTNVDVFGMREGDGRNNVLFSYILPLQQNEFTVEECRECIGIINEFVLKDPLSEDELHTVLRDGAFEKPTFFTSKGSFLFDKFAKYLVKVNNVVKINGKLAIYRNGVYESNETALEAAMIEHIPTLSQAKRKEVLSYLNLLILKNSPMADANLIAFENGVLNVITGELNDFSPEYVVTNKIPHNYNPDARSELMEATMRKLACHDENVENLLYQSVGYCFYRRNELRKSFFLLGEKRNGKSTFLDMVTTTLGEDNVANLDLCEIGDRFRTAELSETLANIGDDINDEWISNSSIFKKVVTGDVVTVEKKGKDPFKLKSFAKFFFSANSLPRIGRGRDSSAVIDRLVIIPFNAKFSKSDADYDPFIKYKLREEPVIEALIAKGVEALRDVLANQEFATCDGVRDSLNEFEKTNDPILEFFEELDEDDYLNEPIKAVYQRYSSFCLSNNLVAVSAIEFRKRMCANYGLCVKTVESDGKRIRVYAEKDGDVE